MPCAPKCQPPDQTRCGFAVTCAFDDVFLLMMFFAKCYQKLQLQVKQEREVAWSIPCACFSIHNGLPLLLLWGQRAIFPQKKVSSPRVKQTLFLPGFCSNYQLPKTAFIYQRRKSGEKDPHGGMSCLVWVFEYQSHQVYALHLAGARKSLFRLDND